MKDYLVTITVKNNVLLQAMRENGIYTAAELSRKSGVSQQAIGFYLNLKVTTTTANGDFKSNIVEISKALKRLPEDLFPPQHLSKKLDKNKVFVELNLLDVENIISYKNTDELLEFKEMKSVIALSLSSLTEREKSVLEYRNGLNGDEEKTLEECGLMLGITKERVRQIEGRAYRKLRHSTRSDRLREYLE